MDVMSRMVRHALPNSRTRMRLIDGNEVVKNIVAERDKIPYELVSEKPFKHGNSMRGGIRKALRCVEQAPTVDAVEVVRCKDCKYLMFSDCYGECGKGHMGIVSPDDFCSYGERKEGAD